MTLHKSGAPPGFTLIELAIVIVIAGILASAAVPIYLSLVDDAKWSEGDAALGSIHQAMQVYHTKHDAYNTDLTVGMTAEDFGPILVLDIDDLSAFEPTDFTLTAVDVDTYTVELESASGDPPGVHSISETGNITVTTP